jgi:glycosyltransferase involved in cell wall biosynthesis
MRILYVCNEYPPEPGGGIGVFVRLLAIALVKAGHTITVIGYSSLLEDKRDEDEGVAIVRLADPFREKKILRVGKYYFSLRPFFLRRNLSKRIELVIKDFRPDFVESYDWSGPLWKKPSVPLVVRMHGANIAYAYYEGIRSSKMLRFFESRNLRIADSLCAVSNHIGMITCSAFNFNRPFTVIYNSTNTNHFCVQSEVKRDFSRILYVGRIAKRKGLIELFKTINILFDLDTNLHLDLAGSLNDQFHEELLLLIDESKRTRINFMGFILNERLPMLYSAAGLFVMPSRAEAFGITAIEAMSTSTAVAVTNKASGPEIVEHGRDGYVVDFTNPSDAATALASILKDKEALLKIGMKARQKVLDNFSLEESLSINVNYYTKVIAHAV